MTARCRSGCRGSTIAAATLPRWIDSERRAESGPPRTVVLRGCGTGDGEKLIRDQREALLVSIRHTNRSGCRHADDALCSFASATAFEMLMAGGLVRVFAAPPVACSIVSVPALSGPGTAASRGSSEAQHHQRLTLSSDAPQLHVARF